MLDAIIEYLNNEGLQAKRHHKHNWIIIIFYEAKLGIVTLDEKRFTLDTSIGNLVGPQFNLADPNITHEIKKWILNGAPNPLKPSTKLSLPASKKPDSPTSSTTTASTSES